MSITQFLLKVSNHYVVGGMSGLPTSSTSLPDRSSLATCSSALHMSVEVTLQISRSS